MARDLHIDVETRSRVDLSKKGAYAYFNDSSTDLYCAAYAFDDGEPELWTPDMPFPAAIREHIQSGGLIYAWNASFERQCWWRILTPRYGWTLPKLEQFRCTMAEAYAMNLPGKLDDAAPALGLTILKDEVGHRLMLQMCKPRKPRKDEPSDALLYFDDEERRQRLYEYCKQDVRTEQAVGTRVLRLRPSEIEIFHLDARINDRGVYIDHQLCHYARKIVAEEFKQLDAQMQDCTGGAVSSVSNIQQLLQFLQDSSVYTKGVAKENITSLLIRNLPEPCRLALEVRQEAAKTSTAKINALLSRRDDDGRMRGTLQYHGAGTGRWSGRGAQLQNLPLPLIIKGEDDEEFLTNYNMAIQSILTGSSVLLRMMYGRPLTVVADCIRGMIMAAPGNDLLAVDFANIEGRDTAWLAGQMDKMDAFRAYDNKTGPDLYLISASDIYGVPINEAKPFRPVGKVAELALGFGGGPGAFANMAKNYGLKVGDLYDGIWERTSEDVRKKVDGAWDWRGKRSGMEERAWKAAEAIKLLWRQKNDRIAHHWGELEDAARDAYDNPGQRIAVGKVQYLANGSFLWCRLPSGRTLCYPYPRLVKNVKVITPDGGEEIMPVEEARRTGLPVKGDARPSLVYKGVDQWTRKWKEKKFYGGLAMENIAQAVARDIMAEAMLRVERAGYPVILTVHDEVVVEVPKNFGSLEEFNGLMSELPSWAKGLPIAAKGWRGERYRK